MTLKTLTPYLEQRVLVTTLACQAAQSRLLDCDRLGLWAEDSLLDFPQHPQMDTSHVASLSFSSAGVCSLLAQGQALGDQSCGEVSVDSSSV